MTTPDQAVREAAAALKAAIVEAQAAGYRVAWPSSPAELDRIAVSETSRVQARLPPEAQPGIAPVAGNRRKASRANSPEGEA